MSSVEKITESEDIKCEETSDVCVCFVCLCVYVFICGHICTRIEILLSILFFETVSFIELGARLTGLHSAKVLLSPLHPSWRCTLLCSALCVCGDLTQTLMLPWQALFWLSHLPSLWLQLFYPKLQSSQDKFESLVWASSQAAHASNFVLRWPE